MSRSSRGPAKWAGRCVWYGVGWYRPVDLLGRYSRGMDRTARCERAGEEMGGIGTAIPGRVRCSERRARLRSGMLVGLGEQLPSLLPFAW